MRRNFAALKREILTNEPIFHQEITTFDHGDK